MAKPDEISPATNPSNLGDEVATWDAFLAGDLDFNDLPEKEKEWARKLLEEAKE